MKNLLYTTLGLIGILGILSIGVAKTEYSQIINITGFNASGESGQLLQSFTQKRDDLELYFLSNTGNISHYTIMDRNIGANLYGDGNPVENGTNGNTIGFYYQWGNNYGFVNMGNITYNQNIRVNVDEFGPGNYYSEEVFHVIKQEPIKTWMITDNPNLRGGNGNIADKQGPCPILYHIPSSNEWLQIYKDWSNANREINDIGIMYASDLNLPFGGYRKSYFNSDVGYQGQLGAYRSSTYDNENASAVSMFVKENEHYTDANTSTRGYLIRCFKNTQTATMNIYPKGGTGAVIAFTGTIGNGNFTALGTPTRSNSIFDGWYGDENYTTQINMGDTVVNDLYAKWECVEGYADIDGECVQAFTITIEANNSSYGTIDSGSVVAVSGATIQANSNPLIIGDVSVSATPASSNTQYTYSFDSWTNDCGDTLTTDCTITANFTKITNKYTITWIDGDGNELKTESVEYGDMPSYEGDTPTKTATSDYTYTFNGTWLPEIVEATANAEYTAQFDATAVEKKSSGYSGGGGRSSKTDTQISPDPSLSRGEEDSSLTKEGDREAVEDLSNKTQDSLAKATEGQYSDEFQQAYNFAHEKGITTMDTIQKANMNGPLTRIAMAKMLSQYAINVLGQKPDETRINKFGDITEKLDADYDNGVTLAYQLGIMGINMPDNKFRPNDEVTRAEFATALSRLLWGDKYNVHHTPSHPFYEKHLPALQAEGIMNDISNPTMKELRGYVMIMLMRSAK